tara:strand:+ start:2457 stop:2843 length:387 start_codon:yes stop_codon:yes gene_type:complete
MGMLLSVLSAVQSVNAGRAKEDAFKRDAERESFAAKDKEIQRKKRLVAALATQNAVRGAQGVVSFEGSSLNMMNQDQETFEYDQSMGAANLAMTRQSLLESGKAARRYGYASATNTLLQSAERTTARG